MEISISRINNANNYKFVQPAFGQRMYYKDIKLVPGNICACCGERVIDSSKLQQAFISTTKPLKSLINKGIFINLQKDYIKIFEYLTNIANNNPKSSFDQIIQNNDAEFKTFKTLLYDNIPTSGIKIQSQKKADLLKEQANRVSRLQKHIQNSSRVEMKKAPAVMKRFNGFKDYLSGTKLDVFEQLEIYAAKYPNKTLSEIINSGEVYNFHRLKNSLQIEELREKREFHIKNIEKMVHKANSNADETFALLAKSLMDMYKDIKDPNARLYMIKQLYREALNKHNCSQLEEKVMQELDKLPSKTTSKDSFFAYAKEHDFTDADIIYSILLPHTGTFEHVIPKSNEGKDAASNGIILCKSCNEKRGTTPYVDFIKYHPEMKENIQKQIDYITTYILQGKMHPSLNFWPLNVAKTLNSYTEGAINPNIQAYCEKSLKKAKIRYKKLQFQYDILTGNKKRYLAELKRNKKNSKQINSKICENKRELEELSQKRDAEKRFIQYLEEKLAEYSLNNH